jgi:hypothetical protein
MDARTGTLEDLPPLELSVLRELDLHEPPRPGRPAHVSSASGIVRRGDHVYVIGDDLLSLAVFRLSRAGPGRLAQALAGELPADEGERKAAKPDLEALTVLPPFEGNPFGALFGLGSGSGPGRDRGFVWALSADGSLRGEAAEVDLTPVYELLRREVGALNVEGACVVGDHLWLLNRGNDEASRNAVAELGLGEVMESLHGDLRLDARELAAIRAYDLGALGGVPLAFSDGTPLANDVLVFTASAEAEDDPGPDGEILGSVLGTITPDGEVRRLRTIDRRYKVEGVHATIDTGVMDLLLVCDQDDPDVVSPLLAATMPLDATHERNSS